MLWCSYFKAQSHFGEWCIETMSSGWCSGLAASSSAAGPPWRSSLHSLWHNQRDLESRRKIVGARQRREWVHVSNRLFWCLDRLVFFVFFSVFFFPSTCAESILDGRRGREEKKTINNNHSIHICRFCVPAHARLEPMCFEQIVAVVIELPRVWVAVTSVRSFRGANKETEGALKKEGGDGKKGNGERGKEKNAKMFCLYLALCPMHHLHVCDCAVLLLISGVKGQRGQAWLDTVERLTVAHRAQRN